MKKILAVIMVACLAFTSVACTAAPQQGAAPQDTASQQATTQDTTPQQGTDDQETNEPQNGTGFQVTGDFRIAIMTNSISQGEEPFRVAAALRERYPDHVVHVTYPDNFTTEQEQTIATMLALAADPTIKAIICVEAVVGTAAAFAAVREIRPDMFLYGGQTSDDPGVISGLMCLGVMNDMPGFAHQLTQAAVDMGVERIIYFTFPRHIARLTTAQQIALFEEVAPAAGIDFIIVTTPDPLGDAGLAGTQQFVLEEVRRQVEQHGPLTAFYSTNIGQSEPIIRSVLETGAFYLTPPEPSPFTGFPGAMGIAIPEEKRGDFNFVMDEIINVLVEHDMEGHMGLWTVPSLTFLIQVGFYYAVEYLSGNITDRADEAALVRVMEQIAGEGVNLRMFPLDEDETEFLENFFFVLAPYKILRR